MNNRYMRIFFFAAMGLIILLSYINRDNAPSNSIDGNIHPGSNQERFVKDMPYSEFLTLVDEGNIMSASIEGNIIKGSTVDSTYYSTRAPRVDDSLINRLMDNGVVFDVKDTTPNVWTSLFMSFLPLLLFLLVVFWFLSRGSRSGKGVFSVGKSKAKLLNPSQTKVTFKDVAGIEEARDDLAEIVDYLKHPMKFMEIGGKIPKGILLVGPPGTGKTLTAKAVAGEAGVPFYTVSGSDFVEMFVGVGASRVRDMFAQARKAAPCIIFIDEIDAVGRKRGGMGTNDEREQTLNQMLVEMDGFEEFNGVIVMAATNRPDVLDPALLRPGRFDRQVVVANPDIKGREQILRVHMSRVSLSPDVDPFTLAKGTPGFSGAELANLVNEAALLTARRNKKVITMSEFESAKDKILMGSERKAMIMTDEEKKLTAYHEAGHALVGIYVEGNDPLHKVTIIPRGRALGVTMNLPEKDRHGYTKKEILAKMAMMFGGRAAEELIFSKDCITTGAGNDIQQATNLARKMVREWGMSEAIGPLDYAENEGGILEGGGRSGVSEQIAYEIDQEVKTLISAAEQKALEVLTTNMGQLHALAEALLEKETMSGMEVTKLLEITKKQATEQSPSGGEPNAEVSVETQ